MFDDEVVSFRLARNGFDDCLVQEPPGGVLAQGRAQIGEILLPETQEQFARAGDSHAVAALAEIVGEGGDESEPPAGLGHLDISRRPGGFVGEFLKMPALLQTLFHEGEGQVIFDAVFLDLAQRHGLDERNVHAASVRPGNQRGDFLFVEGLERNGVDFNLESRVQCGINAFEHLFESPPSRDCGEAFGVQCVEGDVDAAHAESMEIFGVAGELRAVGREREFVKVSGLEVSSQRFDQSHDVSAGEGLAAGEAEAPHAFAYEGDAQALEFLKAQDFLFRQEGHVFGHAVRAAEVAPVGYRDAEVGYRASEGVNERRGDLRYHNTPSIADSPAMRHALQGFRHSISELDLFCPPMVESACAPWERLCLLGIAPRVLSFNGNGFGYFAEGLPAGSLIAWCRCHRRQDRFDNGVFPGRGNFGLGRGF